MKKNKFIMFFYIIQVILLLFFAVGLFEKHESVSFSKEEFLIIEESVSDDDGYQCERTAFGTFTPGVYKVNLYYETDADMSNVWSVKADNASYNGIFSNTCMLYSGKQQADMYVWLTENTDDLYIEVKYGQDCQMVIHGADIQKTNMGSAIALVIALVFSLVCDFGIWHIACQQKRNDYGISEWETKRERRAIFFALIVIVMGASVPLFTGYEIAAADTGFHLLRIEGIKEGLLAGQFPVRMQPNWLQGYGYATGIFYCDTYLYIPALFRIIGFPVGLTYLLYKLLVNFVTTILSYYSFSKMFKDKWAALLGTMLYTLNIYRLVCMYLKDHLGQYTAMAFLPLFVYSIWRLLKEDTETKEYRNNWIILTAAATLIVQCHILTCELTLLFCLIIGIVFVRQIFRKETIKQLVMAVVAIVGINAWFLIPFLDYMSTQHLNITGEAVYTRTIRGAGSLLPQLFGAFALSGGADMDVSGGMQGEIPFTLGVPLLITLIFFLYLWVCGKVESRKMKVCAVLSILALFMATVYFPWDRIQSVGGAVSKLVSALQYPTRMLEMAAVFLALLACSCTMLSYKAEKKDGFYCYISITIVTTVLITGMFFSTLLSSSPFYKLYEGDAMGNAYLSGKEYLPVGTDETLLKEGRYITSDQVILTQASKNGTNIKLTCNNNGNEQGYVEVPLLYYKGYQAHDLQSKQLLETTIGDNNVVRVNIPYEYNGSAIIDFVSPWYWRMAEIISIVFLIGFIVLWRKESKVINKSYGL